MQQLVIGLGEVGRALKNVLSEKYDVSGIDLNSIEGQFDVIHICFPPSKSFEDSVREYQAKYLKEGGLTIIHSSVPVGTSGRLNAVHSPIRGVHPNLELGIKTFVKYFGGERAKEASAIFADLVDKCVYNEDSRVTEAMKLWDTTYYGWNIVFQKLLKKWCEENEIDFESVYTLANKDYNEGYTKLGRPEVVRPVLKYMEGKIGGHCVIENCHLLDGPVPKFILDANENF